MPAEILFEQRWPVDDAVVARTRRRLIMIWSPLTLLGPIVMLAKSPDAPGPAIGTFVLMAALGAASYGLIGLSAHIRRCTALRVTDDGALHVGAFPQRGSSRFDLRRCRAVELRRSAEGTAGAARVMRYDLVVRTVERAHEFMLPGRIGASGNNSTLSDSEVAAFHAAVARFTLAGAD